MKWDWLRPREVSLSWSWKFSAPDASKDKCMRCSVERRYHGKEHEFVEKGK